MSTPPGGYLLEELIARDVAAPDAAKGIGISRQLLEDIVWARAEINQDTAAKIAKYLHTSPGLWLNLQEAFDRGRKKAKKAKP